jgi:hypothetical protein
MLAAKTIAAALLAMTTLTAVPAKAGVSFEFGFGGDGPEISIGDSDDDDTMSPREVRHMLRYRGYHDIDFIDTDGSYYRLTATKHGDDYFIVIDAESGDIVRRDDI